jgi:hypothetical protein
MILNNKNSACSCQGKDDCIPVNIYRILEWTSVFTDGASLVEHEVQCPIGRGKWTTVHKCKTLTEARWWVLDCVPKSNCGLS